jgi:hypothetical protein
MFDPATTPVPCPKPEGEPGQQATAPPALAGARIGIGECAGDVKLF